MIAVLLAGALSAAAVLEQFAQEYNDREPFDSLAEDQRDRIKGRAGTMSFGPHKVRGTRVLAEMVIESRNYPFAGYFLADIQDGKITWFTATDKAPSGGNPLLEAQAADLSTTALGLAQGLVEANPAGLVGAVAMKTATALSARYATAEKCYAAQSTSTPLGWAAAGWNAGMIAFGGPAAIIPAVGVAVVMLPNHNRKFWACTW